MWKLNARDQSPSPSCAEGHYSQLGPLLVDTRDEERDAERPTHHRIFIVHTLSEAQREITDCLGRALYTDGLVIGECVVLRGDARVVDHGARVGGEAGHGAPEVAVDLHDLLDGGRLEERRLYALLDAEDDAFWCADADGGRSELNECWSDLVAYLTIRKSNYGSP